MSRQRLNRMKLYRRRREILRASKARAWSWLACGLAIGVPFGYTWAANAYRPAPRSEFSLGPAVVHHAPNSLPHQPATGEETGL